MASDTRSSGFRFTLRILVLASLLTSISGVALAQSEADRATARELAREGQAAFDRADFETAADRFARADALVHAPTLLLALARSQNKLGKLVQSYESYSRILREGVPDGSPPVFKKAYEDAKKEVEPVRARLGWVTIEIKGPASARVSIDDTAVPSAAVGVRRAVNPGAHVIKAEADGFLPAEQSISVAEGESAPVSLTLEPDPNSGVAPVPGQSGSAEPSGPPTKIEPPPDAPREAASTPRTLAFVALGVGAAGLVVGGVTGVMALGKRGDLDDACPGGQCPAEQRDNLDSYRTLGTISTIGFIVGGVGAAAGVTLLLTSKKSESARAQVTLRLGASGVAVRGSF